MSPGGIQAGGAAFRLPPGASASAMPVLRPLPGGAGRLCLGMIGGAALPAWVLPGATHPPRAWALLPAVDGAMLLGGDALLDQAPAGAEPVPPPPFPPPRLRLTQREEPEEAPAPAGVAQGGFHLLLAQGSGVELPFGALDRLLPIPELHPVPNPPPGVRGMAWTPAGAVLVLDPRPLGAGDEGEAPLLAVLLVEGRRMGLPCRGVVPLAQAQTPAALPAACLSPTLLGLAPLALTPAPVPEPPRRLLLLARASGAAFALPLEEVAAILPPLLPRNPGPGPMAGIAMHRGDVLPVLDAGRSLGRAPVLAGLPVPMIRLPGAQPAALAVTAVLGLRALPEADLAPAAGWGLVAAHARLEEAVLPVLRGHALLAPLQAGAAP